MNILFLIQRGNLASTRYRVSQFIEPLADYGIHSTVEEIPKSLRQRIKILRSAPKYDIVFIQKKLFQPWEMFLMKWYAKYIIYDLDDAVMFKHKSILEGQSPRRDRKFKSTVKQADLVIACNNYLKEQVLPSNSNIVVLPPAVDLERFQPKQYSHQKTVTIGWIGSRSTIGYLHDLKPVLDTLGRRFNNIELKIVADRFIDCDYVPVVKIPWNLDTEISELQRFDIGLVPMPDDPWTRGKCGGKLIHYMAVGVPVICSPVGIYREIIQDGVNGYLASSNEEWFEKISFLIENPILRKKIGQKGRHTVLINHSVEVITPQFAQLLKTCAKQK